jgi:hypothetical protein
MSFNTLWNQSPHNLAKRGPTQNDYDFQVSPDFNNRMEQPQLNIRQQRELYSHDKNIQHHPKEMYSPINSNQINVNQNIQSLKSPRKPFDKNADDFGSPPNDLDNDQRLSVGMI